MTTVFVRDELRASVEGATGGNCTVLYSALGMPSYFHVIPKFNLKDIDASLGTGAHPAFIINGQEVSRLFVGMYLGRIMSGELLSLPGVRPAANYTLDQFASAARACGSGWHVMTNAEWAAIALLCQKNTWLPSGNTDYGRNFFATHETGVRDDGGAPGASGSTAQTLTGSGPLAWRHVQHSHGIADLVGNLRELVAGVRLSEGELQVFQNNNAAAYQGAFSSATEWQAVKFSNGTLQVPGTTGTVKLDSNAANPGSPPQNAGPFSWSATLVNKVGPDNDITEDYNYNGMAFADIGATVPAILKTLALAPIGSMDRMGYAYARNYGTRNFSRGAHYSDGNKAGLFHFDALVSRGVTHHNLGARVVKY